MLEAISPASSTSPSDPSPTVTPAAAVSPTPAPTTSQTPDPAAATPAPTAAPVPKTRPEGVPDSFWDKDKGELKTADWAKSYEELRQAKAEIDARKAQIPAQADLYKPELPKDLKIPAGMEVKTDDPLYVAVRQMAHEEGWTQGQFSRAIGEYAKIEGAKHEALQAAITSRDEALGANGPQRVDALNKRFVAAFGEEVGKQFSQTLFTPAIIKGFEQVFASLSSQGVVKFSAVGREASEGRTDGRPDNWNDMSAMDRRHWNLTNADRKIA